VVNPARRDLDT
jgi:hypothetical protein